MARAPHGRHLGDRGAARRVGQGRAPGAATSGTYISSGVRLPWPDRSVRSFGSAGSTNATGSRCREHHVADATRDGAARVGAEHAHLEELRSRPHPRPVRHELARPGQQLAAAAGRCVEIPEAAVAGHRRAHRAELRNVDPRLRVEVHLAVVGGHEHGCARGQRVDEVAHEPVGERELACEHAVAEAELVRDRVDARVVRVDEPLARLDRPHALLHEPDRRVPAGEARAAQVRAP